MWSKFENIDSGINAIEDFNNEEIVGMFYENNSKEKSSRVWNWNLNREKSENLCVKSKYFDNSFNSWVDEKVLSIALCTRHVAFTEFLTVRTKH